MWYGQIRPSNYRALLEHYGHEPPWPMERSPHVDLVRAILRGQDPAATSYARYIAHHGATADADLAERVGVVRSLMEADELTIKTEADCVIDGNHRWAVAYVLGIPLKCEERPPYQTIDRAISGEEIEGRRFGWPRIPAEVPLGGETILELGSAQCAVTVEALAHHNCNATKVYAVERDQTSLPWLVLDDWGVRHRVEMVVADADDLPADAYPDARVLFAMSVIAHLKPSTFERLAAGRRVLFECHYDDPPPNTKHQWTRLPDVPYSRAQPDSVRSIYFGAP